MRTLKLYLYGLLILLFVVFIVQNYYTLTYSVSLRFNLGFISLVSIPIPLFVVAALLFFGGVVLTTLIHWGERRRWAKEIDQWKRKAPQAQASPTAPQTASPGKSASAPTAPPKEETEKGKKPEGGTIVSSKPLFKKDPPSGDASPRPS